MFRLAQYLRCTFLASSSVRYLSLVFIFIYHRLYSDAYPFRPSYVACRPCIFSFVATRQAIPQRRSTQSHRRPRTVSRNSPRTNDAGSQHRFRCNHHPIYFIPRFDLRSCLSLRSISHLHSTQSLAIGVASYCQFVAHVSRSDCRTSTPSNDERQSSYTSLFTGILSAFAHNK